jgi:RNA polymerase sigma-32 factor
MSASALKSYIQRLGKRPTRLSRAEEKKLARRLRKGGDRAAARALVTAHLPLVVKIARDFRHLHSNFLELIQEGNLALIRAIHRYDPDRPVTVAAYVSSWVRTYIARFILANLAAGAAGFLVEGDDAASVSRDLHRSLRSWRTELGQDEDKDEDADGESSASPPELADPDLLTMALATEEDPAQAPDLVAEARQQQRRLEQVLPEFEQGLTPREREIFRARLFSDAPSTLTQKGADLGLSAERVRQIERDLTDRLRARLAADGPVGAQAPVRAIAPPRILPEPLVLLPDLLAPNTHHLPTGPISSIGDSRTRRSASRDDSELSAPVLRIA